MAEGPAPLRAHGVRIRHEGAEVWTPDGVDLRIASGEVLLVLGPSGCGKSTLALALNGLVPHAVPATLEGTVVVSGVATADARVAELSEHVGMVFQDPDAQLVTGTVLDEVCFGPENRLVPAAEVLERAERALRAVGLWDRRADDPDTLSGGGKQRLAIACALALDAPLLVLDEPTANLDPVGADEVYRLLGELTREGSGRAVVLVEHNLDAAMGIVDTVLVLDAAGRMVAHGPAAEVLRDRAEELAGLGVWLPTATLAALRLRAAGFVLDPLPLTPEELSEGVGSVAGGLSGDPVGRPAVTAVTEATGATGDSDPAIAVSRLTLRRGRREVLHDVSLRIDRGDFVAVVGPNGAGKSTLVQAIAGVLRPPRGAVALGALDPSRASVSELSAAVGFVFQNPEHQFVAHSVVDELAFGLWQRRLPEQEVDDRVDRMLTTLGLGPHREAHPFLLSGGQKRRLSVGTALIAGAPLLVLDEPTFGQDRARAAELLELLAALNAEGTTVVVVTHDLGLAAEYASHVAIVDDGRIAAFGATARILSDADLLERAGLRQPPLVRALADERVPAGLRGATRLRDLPGGTA
ncbi:cobalt ABC transporter ATP-binding protein [Leifsonia sp. LS1]|uniref:ABC transporter ATP-binding protein n=1 Tax=Leifsonia sp. LS1 TaxID=2828483 RepID=UPI001CFDE86B|nr:ABC transporter ATP-binding protein [Leifsonia sp. LS1]GIT79620.1 cobalt ABC transporter ATP-binding protein [Leifsonia sp. LS1]